VNKPRTDYLRVHYPEPHRARTGRLLKAHPELTNLIYPTPTTMLWVLALSALQLSIAVAAPTQPVWLILVVSYVVGAAANHALFVLNHDATHNLVFKKTSHNKWAGIVCNLALFWPGAALYFRHYHLQHHRYQGELGFDGDLPGPLESKIFGRTWWDKALWLGSFWFVQGIVRPFRMKKIATFDRWILINNLVQAAFLIGLYFAFGFWAPAYLWLSTSWAIGLHPLGGRWIQEHFVFHPNQETYSYYGPASRLIFHVGHHNEHHDLMGVAWSNLPKVRKTAPEFYDTLHYHTNYTKLMLRFIFDKNMNLYSRVVRPDHDVEKRTELLNMPKEKLHIGV